MSNNPDSGFEGYNTNTDKADLTSILEAFAPKLAGILGTAITGAFGTSMNSQFGMQGSGMAFGSTTFFGQQDVGQNLSLGFQNAGVNSVMADPIGAMQTEEDRQRRRIFTQFGTDAQGNTLSTGEIDRLMNAPFTATGIAHGLAFNQRQPHLLNQGLREGIQYMGVGFAPDSPEHQINLRNQASVMTSRISESFNDPSNAGKWGGMLGQDVGRVFAEMQRTGATNNLRKGANASISALGDDASEEDIEAVMSRLGDDTVKATQQAARAVQSFRRIFKGSVTEAMDMVNSLMGTDVVGTLGGAEAGLLVNNMASTGMVTGLTRHQMGGMAGLSAQFSQSQGLDPWGAAASGTFAAQLMGVHRQEGSGNAFINESRFQENMIRRVTGAQESGLARDISGAYAVVQDRLGDDAADQFLADIKGKDMKTGTDVAGAASKFQWKGKGIGNSVDAMDINAASFSAAGERARMAGKGTAGALAANMGFLNRTRMHMVRAELSARGLDENAINAIQGSLQDQDLTVDNIMSAAGGSLGDQGLIFRGHLRRRFGEQAEAFGLGNTFEGDAMLGAAGDDTAIDRIQDQVASNTEIQELLSHKGKNSGLANLTAFVTKVTTEGTGFIGAKKFVELLGGDTDVSAADIKKFASVSDHLLKSVKDSKSIDDDHGLNMAIMSLATQTIGDRRMTGKEVKEYQAAIQSGDLKALSKIGETRDDLAPGGMDVITDLIQQILRAIGGMPQ